MPMTAESTVVRVKRDGQIMHSDAGGVHSYVSAYEPGDFSYQVPDVAVNLYLDRGVIADANGLPSIRKGDEAPVTFGYSAYMRDLGDTSPTPAYATLPDLIHRFAGGYCASNWVSTMGANSDVPTVTTTLTIDGASFGEPDKSLIFPFVVLRGGGSEGDPNAIPVTGTSYAVIPTLV